MSSGSSTQTIRQEIDPWLKQEQQGLYDRAQPYANMPYQDFGSGVAGMQPMQRAAQDFLSQGLLGYSPQYSPNQNAMRWPSAAPAPRPPQPYPGYSTTPAPAPTQPWVDPGYGGQPPPGSGGDEDWSGTFTGRSSGGRTPAISQAPVAIAPRLPAGYQPITAPIVAPPGAPQGFGAGANVQSTNPQGSISYGIASGQGVGANGQFDPTQTPEYQAAQKAAAASRTAMTDSPDVAANAALTAERLAGTPRDTLSEIRTLAAAGHTDPTYLARGTGPDGQAAISAYMNGTPYTNPGLGGPSGNPGSYDQSGQGNANPGGGFAPQPFAPGPNSPAPAYTPQSGFGALSGINEAQQGAGIARSVAQGGGVQNVGAERVSTGNVLPGIMGYQDPYESQVVGAALSDIDRSRQLAQGQNASMATMSGAFGGDRHAIVEAETNRAYADQAARTAAQLRSQGFDRASGLAQQDASRALQAGMSNQGAGLQAGLANQNAGLQGQGLQLQGAGLLSSMGGDIYNRTVGSAQALSGAGAQQQAQSQAELNDQMSRFYEMRDYPQQQMQFLQSLLTGQQYGGSTSQTMPRNRGAGVAGGMMSGAGVGSAFGPWGAAAGAGLGGLLGLF